MSTAAGASLAERARARGAPSFAEAVSATGGAAVALGVLLVAIDLSANGTGHVAEAALFAGLILAGYLVVVFLPPETHAAGVSAIALGVPGALGWLLLPGAHSFGDIRPFLVLTILGWIVAFVAPRSRGRTIFVAAAAVVLWLWILGEVAGTDAYSASPIPSPPPHTVLSLQAFAHARSTVELGDLDPSDPLFTFAEECDAGDLSACDLLYHAATPGSDFAAFASTCGNSQPNSDFAGECAGPLSLSPTPFPQVNPIGPIAGATNDKSFDIGLVSAFFGIVYLLALFVLDRGGWRGLSTAFVIPSFLALVTGAESLGIASDHAWVAGALAIVAGLAIGVVGDMTQRRFTAWAGGLTVAYGTMIIAFDAAHITGSTSGGNVKLAGPGLIVMAFGCALVSAGLVIAQFLGWRSLGRAVPPPGADPDAGPDGAPGPDAGSGGSPVAADIPAAGWPPPPGGRPWGDPPS